jgi:hypothetical protein
MLNAVRLMRSDNTSYGSTGGRLNPWRDRNTFEMAFNESHDAYVAARPYVGGHDDNAFEAIIGRALLTSGTFCMRVHEFRQDAVGEDADVFATYRDEMRSDIDDAAALLEQTRRVLRSRSIGRYVQLRRLRARNAELLALGEARVLPRTPLFSAARYKHEHSGRADPESADDTSPFGGLERIATTTGGLGPKGVRASGAARRYERCACARFQVIMTCGTASRSPLSRLVGPPCPQDSFHRSLPTLRCNRSLERDRRRQ